MCCKDKVAEIITKIDASKAALNDFHTETSRIEATLTMVQTTINERLTFLEVQIADLREQLEALDSKFSISSPE